MRTNLMLPLLLASAFLLPAHAAEPAQRPNPQAMTDAQKAAMAPLSFMDGVWRGPARHTDMSGKAYELVQTERIGPFLGGTLKVIEGRGYNPDGKVGFNALAILSWDSEKQAYNFRSYAMGRAGDFPFRLTDDGYVWEVDLGQAVIRYTATIKGGTWHEVGDYLVNDVPPLRIFEMTLQRVGDSDWPAAGAVPMH